MQYQQHRFFNGRLRALSHDGGGQPLRLDDRARRARADGTSRPAAPVSHDRVTDENAPVRIVRESPGGAGAESSHGADWNGLGPGAGPLLRHGPGIAATSRSSRPTIPASRRSWGAPDRAGGEGDLRLHRAQLLPPAAGGGTGCIPAVRESSGAPAWAVTEKGGEGGEAGAVDAVSRGGACCVSCLPPFRLPVLLRLLRLSDDDRTPDRSLLPPRPRSAHAAGAARSSSQRPDIDVRWLDMGSQEILDRLRFERVNPAGRCLVRRSGPDLRPRHPRLAAGALPTGVGRAGEPQGHRTGRSLLPGLPHAGGHRLQQPGGVAGGGAAGLGRGPGAALEGQGDHPRPDGQRNDARHLGSDSLSQPAPDRRHRGRAWRGFAASTARPRPTPSTRPCCTKSWPGRKGW